MLLYHCIECRDIAEFRKCWRGLHFSTFSLSLVAVFYAYIALLLYPLSSQPCVIHHVIMVEHVQVPTLVDAVMDGMGRHVT